MIEKQKIVDKFGGEFIVDDETFVMGVNYRLSDKIAQRFKNCELVLDTCCGAGFMSIAIAKYAKKVIAVDIENNHLRQAQENAKLTNVKNIDFVFGDIIKLLDSSKFNEIAGAFLDPDWAKPNDRKTTHVSSLSDMQPSAETLLRKTRVFTKNICLRLPKEIDMAELKKLPAYELEPIYLNNELKFYCAYFGKLIAK